MNHSRRYVLGAVLAGVAVAVFLLGRMGSSSSVTFADGTRVFVEAISFSTNHVIGTGNEWLYKIREWAPAKLVSFLEPTRGRSRIESAMPSLVFWMHAKDATGKYTDSQGFRAELVDDAGDVFPVARRSHHRFAKFNRIGLVFEVFPRRPEKFTLRLTPAGTTIAYDLAVANPARSKGPHPEWQPEMVPARREAGGLTIILDRLKLESKGGPEASWEAPSRHWVPEFSLQPSEGASNHWEIVHWTGEDPTGNRGKLLPLHETVVKFSATAYPRGEVEPNDREIHVLPAVRMTELGKGRVWEKSLILGGKRVCVTGFFPAGSHSFSLGTHATNVPGKMAGQGWTGMSRAVSTNRRQHWDTYHSRLPVLYVRAPGGVETGRVVSRARLKDGTMVQGKPAEEGSRDWITPHLFAIPAGADEIEIELFVIKPVRAEFVVRTDGP